MTPSTPPIIDAHQHFWTLAKPYCTWPTAAEGAIHRDFIPDDMVPLLANAGVDATVLVQAAPSTLETEDMLALADQTPFIAGVVGWVNFDTPAQAITDLQRFAANRHFVGVRPMLQSIDDTAWILNPEFQAVFHALIRHNLSFDALIQPRHLPVIAELARRHPALSIVIDHGAKPDIAHRAIDPWRTDMNAFTALSNVTCKLSGLLTEAAPGDGAQALKPFTNALLDVFGPDRVIWGSDWPVVNLATDYRSWRAMTDEVLSELLPQDRQSVLGGNAMRVYQLGETIAQDLPAGEERV